VQPLLQLGRGVQRASRRDIDAGPIGLAREGSVTSSIASFFVLLLLATVVSVQDACVTLTSLT